MIAGIFISLLSTAFAQIELYPCEGGVFIPEQFEGGNWAGDVEQPLEQLGVDLALAEEDCEDFPYSGECADNLYVTGAEYFDALVLSDPHPDNPTRSYGDVWCEILAASIQGNNKEIESQFPVVYGRIYGCDNHAGSWNNTVTFATHDEYFCCDFDGNYDEVNGCPAPAVGRVNLDADVLW